MKVAGHRKGGVETYGAILGRRIGHGQSHGTAHSVGDAGATPCGSVHYEVTHVWIPKQTCTKHSCDPDAVFVEEMHSFMDDHQLRLLGWVHTHPPSAGGDAFLSSIDLHTACVAQKDDYNYVSVVVGATASEVFRLTDEHDESRTRNRVRTNGMAIIQACTVRDVAYAFYSPRLCIQSCHFAITRLSMCRERGHTITSAMKSKLLDLVSKGTMFGEKAAMPVIQSSSSSTT